nr:vanadium-dependent haloperoxidase [Synechococcus sp. MU1655]
MSDAGIATWNVKYFYNSVRPVTAIGQYKPNEVLSDGSLAKDWRPYLPTPPFPDIPSGHSAFSSSANYIFNQSFDSNYFDFSVTLADDDSVYSVDGFDGIPGIGDEVTISAVYFTGAAAQAGDSRIYGGIHLKDGDLQGQIIGYITGSQVLQKIDSLEQGLSLEEVSSLPIQLFGTMKNDTLTGLSLEDFDEIPVQQLYAFDGEDVIVVKGDSLWEVYGGSGMDTFQFYETGFVSLRDYESMEEIELAPTIFQQGESLEDIQFSISANQDPFTDVFLNDRLLFTMDGYWDPENVNLSILA